VAPPLLPALLGGATLVFVLAMREIDAAILVPAANGTVLFRLYNAVHFGRDDFVAALALLVVFFVLLPGLLWSLFARRRLEFLP
jgi:ABC-type spermidine/putrescine transport system permease subunit II